MGCPMCSKIEWSYLYKYYPKEYVEIINMIKKSKARTGHDSLSSDDRYGIEYIERISKTKYLEQLNKKEYIETLIQEGFNNGHTNNGTTTKCIETN